MSKLLLIYLVSFGSVYGIAIAIAILTDTGLFSNILGCFALISYLCTVIPGLIKTIVPQWKRNKLLNWLLRYRRQIGVTAFLFALNHGVLQIIKHKLNLLDPMTYAHYFQGFSMMLILTILAFTSSSEAVKHFRKNWQKLHRLTYLVILILPWHILDKMYGHWSQYTPFTVATSLLFVVLLFARLYKERLQIA